MRQAFDRICKEAEDGVRSRLPARRADRRQRRRRPRGAADDPGGGLRAFLPGAPVAAHLHLAQRALGRMPRRALCRRHHRRRRHHGEPLPRRGDDRGPPRARPVRQAVARPVPRQLQEGARRRPAQDHVEDGHLGAVVLPRRLQLRGGRPVALAGAGILPRHALAHLRHRPARRAGEDRRAACPRLRRGRDRAADRRLLQDAARRRPAQFRGQPDPHAAGRGQHRVLREVPEVQRGGAPPAADQPARPARLPPDRKPVAIDEVEFDHRAAQAPGGARHLARRARPGGARDAVDRHEPHRRQVRFGRRRRGSGALSRRGQRRQRLVGHQAGRVGPLRRHGGVSQQLPRARDQGGPGRQARRGRPASRPQGQRDDRPAAPFDARRDPDQPAAASRHLLDRGSGAAHLRPEADQPRGAGHGEAGGALGHRHHRGRRRQGQGRRDPGVGPQRRHRRQPADQHQVRRHPLGDGPVGDAPGADAQPPAREGAAAHRRRHQDRPRRGDRRHAGRRGVRHRHGLADRHGLHHGAAVPFQHLPGRRLHAGPQAARQVRGLAGEGRQPLQLRRRGGARDPGAARLPLAARDRRPLRPAEAGQPRRALSRRSRPQPAADARRRRPRARCIARSRAATRCPTRSTPR